jgi:hypothetical protein
LKTWIKKAINNFFYLKGSSYGFYWNKKEGGQQQENTDSVICEICTGPQGESDYNDRNWAKSYIAGHSAGPNG